MTAMGLAIELLAYLESSLFMLSGSDVQPFFRAFSAFSTSLVSTGARSCLGAPMSAYNGLSYVSVNCYSNHSWIRSAFPWSVPAKCPSWLCADTES